MTKTETYILADSQRQTDRGRDGQGQTDINCGQTGRQRKKTDTTMGSKDRNTHRKCRHTDRHRLKQASLTLFIAQN